MTAGQGVANGLRVGLIGAGVFGGYHAAKVAASGRAVLSGVHDGLADRSSLLAGRFGARHFGSAGDLMAASDAVIIATPATSHAALAGQALEAGCHVLAEKPLALSGEAALHLAALADANGLVLQAGHQERLVFAALGLWEVGEPPAAMRFTRNGLPPKDGRAMDVSVTWDLMIHDIDLACALAGPGGRVAEAAGRAAAGRLPDTVSARLLMGETDVFLSASRCAGRVERTVSLSYPSGIVDIDLVARKVSNMSAHRLNERFAEAVPDPLGAADEAFFAACRGEGPCLVPGREAAEAVRLAEAIDRLARAGTGA